MGDSAIKGHGRIGFDNDDLDIISDGLSGDIKIITPFHPLYNCHLYIDHILSQNLYNDHSDIF